MDGSIHRQAMRERYQNVRQQTERLCAPLAVEDYVIQSMPDASPARWHLAHTTWFFETFVLAQACPGHTPWHNDFAYLFNSYYNQIGAQYPRPKRGLLSRPSVAEIYDYRCAVDERMEAILSAGDERVEPFLPTIELGLQHEQQHQELILTDLKHMLSCNPLFPVYRAWTSEPTPPAPLPRLAWVEGKSGVYEIGHNGDGFAYDNEGPRHATWLQPHALASRPIVNGEYLEFINAGGYGCPELWLSMGWDTVRANQWEAPLHWVKVAGDWWHFTLAGLRPLNLDAPVCHVSYFEAEAYARWSGARLPTEAEWETAASAYPLEGHFVESGRHQPLPPTPLAGAGPLLQLFGDVWEWTSSPYSPYPGFSPAAGAVGEYNGKFMCNQLVLRGGSCATPHDHIRHTYRNFFQPEARWQFSGFRLAR
jgi:ergothioneine biosynthesis protein EgtB